MLDEVADGVYVRQSTFCHSNTIVVRRAHGLLLIDPGVTGDELAALADDLDALGPVAGGFATHPHWDHLLWHARFGDVPRWASPRAAAVTADRLADATEKAARLAPGAPLDLLGRVSALPGGTIPGFPDVQVIVHDAHAPGHAALVVGPPERADTVLIAGDLLSDVEVPLLDLRGADPLGDYTAGLDRLPQTAVLIPGHGAVATGTQVAARFTADRAYLDALAAGREPVDARVGPDAEYGQDWLPAQHDTQVRHVLGGASTQSHDPGTETAN